jgi:hypothetical protein
MDPKILTSAAADANKIDEILSISPKGEAAARTETNGRSDGVEDALRARKANLTLLLKDTTQDQSNIKQPTPTLSETTTTTKTACQQQKPQQPIYNEFVNHHVYANNKSDSKQQQQHEEEDEDVKPLLKSIVKSPSGNVRPTLPLGNGAIKTKNKRLSWQAMSNPTRHPLLQDTRNGNTQSTSLESSDEHPITQNEEVPSSPIVSSSSSSSSSSGSSSDDDDFSEIVFQAPDGGYGWVVVFVSFLINMIADGITFSFGVFNVEFLKYFGDSKGKTAWISSIFMATPLLSGPIASYLTDRYGCRKVTIVGAIFASIGFLLSGKREIFNLSNIY